jgi:nucleoside 2-deoxyribosyltransferase
MVLKSSEKATLVKEIARRLGAEDWASIDATLQIFSLPTLESWNGSQTSYVLQSLRDAPDSTLLEMAEHVGFSLKTKATTVSPPFWQPDMFRLFVSHLSAHRKFAAELQTHLQKLGISAFVAHNDIEPTKEWQNEIEAALSTCDALVALLHPDFHKSNWTDQEIGYAMGRGLPVFSVRCGQDPYGFIGKFQAVNGSAKSAPELAKELFDVLRKGKQTQTRLSGILVELFASSRSFESARQRLSYLEELTVWEPSFSVKIRSAVKENDQISQSFGVPDRVKQLLKKWAA